MTKFPILALVALLVLPNMALAKSSSDLLFDLIDSSIDIVELYQDKVEAKVKEQSVSQNITHDQSFPYINQKPVDFKDAKLWLKKVTRKYGVKTLYTDCDINVVENDRGYLSMKVEPNACGLNVYKSESRAVRAEAEHISPASAFGRTLECWKNGGRSNCNDTSAVFNIVEADPHNLQYAVGSVNADRLNYEFSEFSKGYGVHDYKGDGDVLFDDRRDLFEPPESKKGWIGRAHLYMNDKYGVPMSSSYLDMMKRWAEQPPSAWECKYNLLVKRDFGYDNKFTTAACLK